MRPGDLITHDLVTREVARFEMLGGKIKKLPDQVTFYRGNTANGVSSTPGPASWSQGDERNFVGNGFQPVPDFDLYAEAKAS